MTISAVFKNRSMAVDACLELDDFIVEPALYRRKGKIKSMQLIIDLPSVPPLRARELEAKAEQIITKYEGVILR